MPKKLHKGKMLFSKNGFDLIECINCGYKHITPIPSEEELRKVYEHEYYKSEKPLYIERYIEDEEWHFSQITRRLELFEKILDKKSNLRLLDIGSGPGFFIKVAKERGWEALGFEPSREAYEYSTKELGLNVYNEFFNEHNYKKIGNFDAVNLSLVLEHVPNPENIISMVYKIIKPGGIVSISVPNDFNPIQSLVQKMGNDPWWVAPPHHINYFDHQTLDRFISNNGFETVHQEGSFPIDIFLLMGDNYINNDSLGREIHNRRKLFDLSIFKDGFSDIFYKNIAKIGIGREAILIAIKKRKCQE